MSDQPQPTVLSDNVPQKHVRPFKEGWSPKTWLELKDAILIEVFKELKKKGKL